MGRWHITVLIAFFTAGNVPIMQYRMKYPMKVYSLYAQHSKSRMVSNMELTKDRLYVFRVEGMDYNEKEHRMDYKLSKECVFFDKGRAVYYQGFTNHFILIGLLKMILIDLAQDILQTAHKLDDTFIIGNQGMAIIWTGTWEPLERSGMICSSFSRGLLDSMIREIHESVKKNGGKLVDRC